MGEIVSLSLLFQPRIYINGKQIFLDDKCLENLKHFLDEFNPKNDKELVEQLPEIYNLSNIRKIFGKLIPEDSELLNPKDLEGDKKLYYILFNIYNFYSKSLYTKINKEHSSFKFHGLKMLEECKKFKIYEFNPSTKEDKLSCSIIIFGEEESNNKFIDGFVNFLFGVNEDDNYRLILGKNNDNPKDLFKKKYINTEKGNFTFYCFDPKQKQFKEFIELCKYIQNKSINLVLFNNFDVEFLPKLELKDSEKYSYSIFFASPGIGFDYLILQAFEKENKLYAKFESFKNDEYKNSLMILKERILKKAKFDQTIRNKFSSSYFIYDSIYNKEKNRDIYYKYLITMDGYKSFYSKVISQGKQNSINFSDAFITFLLNVQEKSKILEKKLDNFKEKKGENWTEYHLYEIKMKNLSKDNQSKDEIEILNEKKRVVYNNNRTKINDDISKFNNMLDQTENLKLYEILLYGYYYKKLKKKEIEESYCGCCC